MTLATRVKHSVVVATAVVAGLAAAQPSRAADTVEVYAAGSLRGVLSELATTAGPALGIEIKASFGGSGSMRERIEKGELADLLMSADVGSPRKLVAENRTVVPAIAFARNRVCIVSRRAAGITPQNLVARLLQPKTRLKTSQPVVDPGGDYAWAILESIDAAHPGAGAILKHKAEVNMDLKAEPNPPGQSAAAALFSSGKIDVTITYCSGTPALLKELPELKSFEVPAQFDPHPLYGIAVLSDKPAALRLALFLLSEKGQEIIGHAGLVPLTGPVEPRS